MGFYFSLTQAQIDREDIGNFFFFFLQLFWNCPTRLLYVFSLHSPIESTAEFERWRGSKKKIPVSWMKKGDLKASFKNQVMTHFKMWGRAYLHCPQLISNTFRHAQATCLDVYHQTWNWAGVLKVTDNGRFSAKWWRTNCAMVYEISKNEWKIAGTIQLLTAICQRFLYCWYPWSRFLIW